MKYKFDYGRGGVQFREEVASRFVLDDWLFKHEGFVGENTHNIGAHQTIVCLSTLLQLLVYDVCYDTTIAN